MKWFIYTVQYIYRVLAKLNEVKKKMRKSKEQIVAEQKLTARLLRRVRGVSDKSLHKAKVASAKARVDVSNFGKGVKVILTDYQKMVKEDFATSKLTGTLLKSRLTDYWNMITGDVKALFSLEKEDEPTTEQEVTSEAEQPE